MNKCIKREQTRVVMSSLMRIMDYREASPDLALVAPPSVFHIPYAAHLAEGRRNCLGSPWGRNVKILSWPRVGGCLKMTASGKEDDSAQRAVI